ncbi:hypothetical protein [Allofournierella massiliensis]|uniref:Cell envelope-related transcriptional attenuator domain-containing protein n=1 Tax=Allofournierella massiliensis TaxID=1650663 RepID=A0A4R1R5J8_9FIRM|nr:hypothetical protein [Fournierella massiliensis]TCL60791.1 hypothetical protein EDD77_103114 [Fournierella massiliensis]
MQSGPKAFWLSFFLTLAILVPLLGGFVLYGLWQQSTAAPAQITQSGVPVASPSQENDHTLFVAVAAEEPGFVLLRLDGMNNVIRICPVPAVSVVSAPGGPTLLRDSYSSAGPGRAAELLSQTLNIQIDRYLAITPASLGTAWNGMEPPRVNLTGLLEPQELAALGLSEDPVVSLAPESASEFLAKLKGEGVPPARLERIRGAVWDAALRQQLPGLSTTLIEGLRKASSTLLSNLTLTDLYDMQDTLEFLARQQAQVEAQVVPGRWEGEERYEFTEDSVAFARSWFCQREQETESPALATPGPSAGAAGASPSPSAGPTASPSAQAGPSPSPVGSPSSSASPAPPVSGAPAGALG